MTWNELTEAYARGGYADLTAEAIMRVELPKVPLVFTKQSTSIAGPFDPIFWSEEGKALDYEGELAVVIGRTARAVAAANAIDFVAGYTICIDYSERDWQKKRLLFPCATCAAASAIWMWSD